MGAAKSKVTAQGQISVPVAVRKKLGIGPGSVLQWYEDDGRMVVRRAGKYTFQDIHKILFPAGPPAYRTDADLKEGIAQHMREKYARR